MDNGSGEKRKSTDESQGPKCKKQRKVLKTNADIITQAHLLTIPGELRNIIYRLVLLSEDRIKIDKRHRKMPPLLRTCQQIYAEARSIHFGENSFQVTVRHLHPTVPSHHWIFNQQVRLDLHVKLIGKSDWENLVSWLSCYHRHRGKYLGCFRDRNSTLERLDHVCLAFDIVKKMLRTKWEVVRAVLDIYREGSGLRKMKWV
ncbi:hypothetical protein KC340_g14061 [Hortaea werneckii]|nr:hypothetical protein KC342_g14357 [Hortaea werneckii]KAI7067099.1 hypothetical protein KC339_g15356 [Hortaea werneckii]KAI7219651.1 hypothetical protein KC365_g12247 [Hortaea werneckii]KAI7298959.1 hypothetical protein KC340_g14061 [Hortaea werneckii]KAI7375677.1 hypothetical protein KC328_g15290 [Hortaea werneckii]